MQTHDNIVRLTATVQEPRDGQVNPRKVSAKFAAVSAEVTNAKGRCWIDVVGNGSLVATLSALTPGKAFNVTGRLDSSKGSDGRWRTRIWADAIETDVGQLTLEAGTTSA